LDLDSLLVIFLFLGFVAYMANRAPRAKDPNACPPHKWDYDETGFLKCTKPNCGRRPGEGPSIGW
jgi:hypothetical protein